MKSGVAVYTMAVKAVLNSGLIPRGNIYMHYVIDEEFTSNGTLAALMRGCVADGAINAEASGLEVQSSVSGSMWFTVEVRGRLHQCQEFGGLGETVMNRPTETHTNRRRGTVEDVIRTVKVMAVHIIEWSRIEYTGKQGK